jgi:hypothetical protein
MPVPLPDLSHWSFEDLLQEMIGSIPKYNPNWTNFNPSDPGVTLLEMLAWIAQTFIYRAEEMPEEVYRTFLQLVTGPERFMGWKNDQAFQQFAAWRRLAGVPAPDWETLKGESERFLNSRYRAITPEDFRALALEAAPDWIKRVEVQETAWDEVELILVPVKRDQAKAKGGSQPPLDKELITMVLKYLRPRRLLGTPIRVRLAVFTPVRLKITLIGGERAVVENRIRLYLDSFQGGPEGKGWLYGRNLTVFDLFYMLEKVEEVKHVREITGSNRMSGGLFPFKELAIDGLIDLQPLEVITEKDGD